MTICLIDTSILCEILKVPRKCGNFEATLAELRRKEWDRESLFIPISTILETGNHIGQNGDGRQRREVASRFVRMVEQAVRGETPFLPTRFFRPQDLLTWFDAFPDWAGRGSGLGDLTILKEFERQCERHRRRRVYIWSTDRHLSSYRREP